MDKKSKLLPGGYIGNLSVGLFIVDTKVRASCAYLSQLVRTYMNCKLKSQTTNTLTVGTAFRPV